MTNLPEWKQKYISERIEGEFVLSGPNEFAWSIRDLCFGMQEYDDEHHEVRGKVLWTGYKRPSNWRELVGDRYAMLPIASDIDHVGSFLPFGEIFDPYTLEDMLIRHPSVIREVNALTAVGFRLDELRGLKIAVNSVFRGHYKKLFLQAYDEAKTKQQALLDERQLYCPTGEPLPLPAWFTEGPEPQWKQACKQFDMAVEIIALFMCRHFTMYRKHWAPLLAEHADLSQYHKHFTTQGLAPRRPMPLE